MTVATTRCENACDDAFSLRSTCSLKLQIVKGKQQLVRSNAFDGFLVRVLINETVPVLDHVCDNFYFFQIENLWCIACQIKQD